MTPNPDPRELLQLISEGFVFVDREFCVVEMNAEAERIEGRPASAIVGHSIWDCWPDLQSAELGRLWRQAIADQKPVSLEHFYTWPSGRQAWIEMRAFPSDGGLAIFFRDISDRKRAEDELQNAQRELIHASRLSAMEAMAATLAHELSQPLTAISNYIGTTEKLIRSRSPDIPSAAQTLSRAGAATERTREILKRMRAFVAKGQVETRRHEIRTIIADASVLILPHAEREGVEIEYRLEPENLWIMGDAIQLQQVLINLIRNAIEAMRESGERRITISTIGTSDIVQVAVRDRGTGITGSESELFTPFSSTKAEGLGVGLSLSRTIVEAHAGTIAVQSSPEGSTFRVTLPRVPTQN